MLIDKYLPVYQFSEYHSLDIKGPVESLYQKMLETDFSKSTLIRILFSLRGLPKGLTTIEQLTQLGFVKLGEEENTEILFGIVTDSGVFRDCRSNISPQAFTALAEPTIIKAVINFQVKEKHNQQQVISTETRVWCGRKRKKTFRLYWFVVKPFSKLVRKAMLKEIQKQFTVK